MSRRTAPTVAPLERGVPSALGRLFVIATAEQRGGGGKHTLKARQARRIGRRAGTGRFLHLLGRLVPLLSRRGAVVVSRGTHDYAEQGEQRLRHLATTTPASAERLAGALRVHHSGPSVGRGVHSGGRKDSEACGRGWICSTMGAWPARPAQENGGLRELRAEAAGEGVAVKDDYGSHTKLMRSESKKLRSGEFATEWLRVINRA